MNNIVDWMAEREATLVPLSSPKAKAIRFCEGSVVKIGCTWQEVTSKNRKRRIIDARKCITHYLTDLGWTTVAIGKVLNLHYTSIVHHKQSFAQIHAVDAEFRHIWRLFSEK
jgi:hypothetical protein